MLISSFCQHTTRLDHRSMQFALTDILLLSRLTLIRFPLKSHFDLSSPLVFPPIFVHGMKNQDDYPMSQLPLPRLLAMD